MLDEILFKVLAFIAAAGGIGLWWYYCPMTQMEFMASVRKENRKLHMKCYTSRIYRQPTRIDEVVFVIWVILTQWPKGRIVMVGHQQGSGRQPHPPDPSGHYRDEWTMYTHFWHHSYRAFGENDPYPQDNLVEI